MKKRIKYFIQNIIILVFIIIFLFSFTIDGNNFSLLKENISLNFRCENILIEGYGRGYVIINYSELPKITLDNINMLLNGFEADITYLYNNDKFCFFILSNITTNTNKKNTLIKTCNGVIKIIGKSIPELDLNIHFITVSIYTYLFIQILSFIILKYILTKLIGRYCIKNYPESKILFLLNIFVINQIIFSQLINFAYNATITLTIIFIALLGMINFLYDLSLAKKALKNIEYTLFIIVLSTYSIFYFSNIFTIYYCRQENIYNLITFQNIIIPSPNQNNLRRYLSYIEFSFKYYFEFPPDELYGWIAIFQFVIGKIYELVILGGIGNLILQFAKKKDNSLNN